MNYAVIDLGTNTFHILIAKKSGRFIEEVYRKRVFVNIAQDGIETIGIDCYQRGMDTIIEFHESLKNYNVTALKVFGTAALRTATNGPKFQDEVFSKTGIEIEIIDGRREAQLIARGIGSIVDTTIGNYLIMDIGGGSVEFILIKDGNEVYIESYPIGITALYNRFPHGEPISEKEIREISDYLNDKLAPLFLHIKSLDLDALIGASGSYEVLEKIISGSVSKNEAREFPTGVILTEIEKIIKMDLSTRINHPSIPEQRAKLIIMAFLLMRVVLDASKFRSVITSPYALKEGALAELLDLD